MTALPGRRRRRTVVGAVVALVLVLVAAGLAAAGAMTVVNSKAGETVVGETRPVVTFPNTDNAALAVVDDEGRLTSLIVATLLPEGVGGSIVTIPVNADASTGLGDTRRPLDRVLDEELGDAERFFEEVEGTLAISLQFGEIASAERLEALLGPVVPVTVDLAAPIFDSSTPGTGEVVRAGESALSPGHAVRALRAFDEAGTPYDHHPRDVELWSALAANAPVPNSTLPPTDDFDRPVPSTTIDEVFDRLWAGPVQVRDLIASETSDGDAVVLDRQDSLLVFAQASPARVSTPNPGLAFRVVVPYSDAQVTATDDLFVTRSEIARTLIGQLLFLSANVVSVDTTPRSDGASERSRIEVADERFVEDITSLLPLVFGDADVVVATELVDGVDVVLTLGTAYLDLQEQERSGAPDTAGSADGQPAGGVTTDDPNGGDPDATDDTVDADG